MCSFNTSTSTCESKIEHFLSIYKTLSTSKGWWQLQSTQSSPINQDVWSIIPNGLCKFSQLIYAWLSTLCYFLLILQVSNNGYISLNGYTGGYTPRPFPYRSIKPIIAPYWADIDTRSGSGRVYYGETTSSSLRSRAAALVRRIYQVSFSPTHLFIATWYNVGYYNRHTNRVINSCWSLITRVYEFLLITTCLVYWGQNGCMLMEPKGHCYIRMWTQQQK